MERAWWGTENECGSLSQERRGNIGTALLDALVPDPAVDDVGALARRPPQRSWPKVSFSSVDLSTDDLAPHLRGADAVVHLAWVFQPTHRPLDTWRNNVQGSLRLFQAVAAHHVPVLVYASSVGAYSPAQGLEIDESRPTACRPPDTVARRPTWSGSSTPSKRGTSAFGSSVCGRRLFSSDRREPSSDASSRDRWRRRRYSVSRAYPWCRTREGCGSRPCMLGRRSRLQTLCGPGVPGAFNIAAQPVIDGVALAELLGGRPAPLPPRLVRAALAGAWRTHLVPAEPALFDLAMGMPVMRTDRARTELGWTPSCSATEALAEAVAGMSRGAGGPTAPLSPDSVGGRVAEMATGVGERG